MTDIGLDGEKRKEKDVKPLYKRPFSGTQRRTKPLALRPKKLPPTHEEVYKLARNFLPTADICTLLNISEKHLTECYQGTMDKAHAGTRAKLLEVLKNMSFINKNERITIWLSKIWLGYQETTAETAPSTQINIKINEIPAETTIAATSSPSVAREGQRVAAKALIESRPVSEGLNGTVVQGKGEKGGG